MDNLKKYKNSDTLVIYGSGYSINNLSDEQKKRLSDYDSIGFNYFCKSGIPTTFYLLREQTRVKNKFKDEDPTTIIKQLNKDYSKSCLLFINSKQIKNGWCSYKSSFKNEKEQLEEVSYPLIYDKYFCKTDPYREKTPENQRIEKENPVRILHNPYKIEKYCQTIKETDITKSIIYYVGTISLALHLSVSLDYKNVIFAGVDLYDHRYFWLPYDELRAQTKAKKRGIDQRHKTGLFTCFLMERFVKYFNNMNFKVCNQKSLLSEYMDGWK